MSAAFEANCEITHSFGGDWSGRGGVGKTIICGEVVSQEKGTSIFALGESDVDTVCMCGSTKYRKCSGK